MKTRFTLALSVFTVCAATSPLVAQNQVAAWGNSSGAPFVPNGLTNVKQVAAGVFSYVALKSDGTVVSWGEVPNNPALSNVVEVAAGGRHALALRQRWNGCGVGK